MPTDTAPETRATQATITIQGHEFTIALPYAAGHVLTENEANALNQVRLENIRNNSAAKIKAAAKSAEPEIKPEDVDLDGTTVGEGENAMSLRASIEAYAEAYEFGARQAGTRAEPVDPVQREALRIAREAVLGALKAKGTKRKDVADDAFEAAVERYAARDEVQKEAQRRVKARDKIGTEEVDDILAGIGGEAEGNGEG